MTIDEKYYQIVTNLNLYLQSLGSTCKVYKYGFDIAQLKTEVNSSKEKIFPYAIMNLNNVFENGWTSQESGVYTLFDIQINFFTSPENEYENDSEKFKDFERIKRAFTDIYRQVLKITDSVTNKSVMVADILRVDSITPNYSFQSGLVLPTKILVLKMATVCSYPDNLGNAGNATNVNGVLGFDFII